MFGNRNKISVGVDLLNEIALNKPYIKPIQQQNEFNNLLIEISKQLREICIGDNVGFANSLGKRELLESLIDKYFDIFNVLYR